jgi:hypothetical protein
VRANSTHYAGDSDKCFAKHLRANLHACNLGHFTDIACAEPSTVPEV